MFALTKVDLKHCSRCLQKLQDYLDTVFQVQAETRIGLGDTATLEITMPILRKNDELELKHPNCFWEVHS